MTKEFLEQNCIEKIDMDTYIIFQFPIKDSTKRKVLIYIDGITIEFGEIFIDKLTNVTQSISISNEAVCLVKEENKIKTAKKLLYLPVLTLIEDKDEDLTEIYTLLFGINLNEVYEQSQSHYTLS